MIIMLINQSVNGILSSNVFESLGLGWQDILFHTVNLLILIVALRFLLYKPIKRLINNHKAKLNDMFEQNKKLSDEANEMKVKYERMMEEARAEIVKNNAQAVENARRKSEETINDAKVRAKNIVDTAKRETEAEKERFKNDFKDTVSKLAVDIAERVLQREVSESDNRKIIDECLKEWEEK